MLEDEYKCYILNITSKICLNNILREYESIHAKEYWLF